MKKWLSSSLLITSLSISLGVQAQILDDVFNPRPQPKAEKCSEIFETFEPSTVRTLRGHFESGNDREFYKALSLSGIKPHHVMNSGTSYCYSLLFTFVHARPTNGVWTDAHKEMIFHLFDLGFDPNDQVRNTPTTNGGASNQPVIARFGGQEDITMLKWFIEGGANLYQAYSTEGGLYWYTPFSEIMYNDIQTQHQELPATLYIINDLKYPLFEGGLCKAWIMRGQSRTYRNHDLSVGHIISDRLFDIFIANIEDTGKCLSDLAGARLLERNGGYLEW